MLFRTECARVPLSEEPAVMSRPAEPSSPDEPPTTPDAKVTARRFAVLFALGLLGVLSLVPTTVEQAANAPLPPGTSLPVLVAVSLLSSTVLLAVAVLVGLKTAPRLGLQSHLLDRVVDGTPVSPKLRRDLRPAVRWGLLAGVAMVVVQFGFAAVVDSLAPQTDGVTVGSILATVPLRFLYGGITEELLLRWGFMSAVAYALFVANGRDRTEPSASVLWAAILVSAVVFGVGHLPAAAATTTLTPSLLAYVVVGNAVGGVVFGWVFWRRSLEAAMLSHASAHVVFVAGSIAVLLVG